MIDTTHLKTLDPKTRDVLRSKSALLGRPLIGPRSINIVVVQSCDRRCAFCWYFSPLVKNHPPYTVLDYAVLERALEDCQEIGVDEINFEGGEITLYPQIEKAFRKVKELGMDLRAYSHLDFETKHLRYLALADTLTINVSAMTEDLYQRVHGKPTGKLSNLVKHLDLLLNLRRKYGKPKIILTFIVYKDNYKQLRDFLDFAQEREADQVVIRFFKATQEMSELMLSEDEFGELREIVREAVEAPFTFKHNLKSLRDIVEKGRMFENTVAIDHAPMHNDRLFFYDSSEGTKIFCHWGWFYSHIDEFGQVAVPCDNVGVCIVGNIYERSFKDIWFNNEKMNAILREASAGIKASDPKWKECRHCSNIALNNILHEHVTKAAEKQSEYR